MDLDAVIKAADSKLQSALEAAKQRYDHEVEASHSEHAKTLSAVNLIRSERVLDAIRVCEAAMAPGAQIGDIGNAITKDQPDTNTYPKVQEETDEPMSVTDIVRMYAQSHPDSITMPEVAAFATNFPQVEVTRARISDAFYKMTHRSGELEVARRGIGNRPGIWRVKRQPQEKASA